MRGDLTIFLLRKIPYFAIWSFNIVTKGKKDSKEMHRIRNEKVTDTCDNGTVLSIPYKYLSPEVLEAVIEEFVTRDGTDYGGTEVLLQTKVAQVKRELAHGRAIIVFDEQTGTCNIISTDDPLFKDFLK